MLHILLNLAQKLDNLDLSKQAGQLDRLVRANWKDDETQVNLGDPNVLIEDDPEVSQDVEMQERYRRDLDKQELLEDIYKNLIEKLDERPLEKNNQASSLHHFIQLFFDADNWIKIQYLEDRNLPSIRALLYWNHQISELLIPIPVPADGDFVETVASLVAAKVPT